MSIETGLDTGIVEKLAQVHVNTSHDGPSSSMKTSKHGVVLVPQPTDDPDEPLVRSLLASASVYASQQRYEFLTCVF
jgi:hypothetical protein